MVIYEGADSAGAQLINALHLQSAEAEPKAERFLEDASKSFDKRPVTCRNCSDTQTSNQGVISCLLAGTVERKILLLGKGNHVQPTAESLQMFTN